MPRFLEPAEWSAQSTLGRIENHIIEIKNILHPGRVCDNPGRRMSGKTMKAKKGKRIGGIGRSSRGPKKPIRKGKLTKKKKSRGKR